MIAKTRMLFMVLCTGVFSIFRCAAPPVGGIEITNGTCTGKIYNKDNTEAAGALVRLIPSGYDPLSSGGVGIDSTTTGADGRYQFDIPETDFYNILAEKDDLSCLQDSISLLEDGAYEIDNDTLGEPGWLAGTVEVKPGSDPLQAVILVLGTNRYTSPVDSLGTFNALALPAGSYTVKVFTSESGYDAGEYRVTVPSGDTALLGARIPTSFAPDIEEFSVSYDRAMMIATLRWTPADTAQLRSFALRRYVDGAEDSIIIIDGNRSEYHDDCISYFEKTVTWEINAVGSNYKEGYAAASAPLYVCGLPESYTKTLLGSYTPHEDFQHSGVNLCVGPDGNRYLYTNNVIVKLGSDGATVNTVDTADFDSLERISISSVTCDKNGNLYVAMRATLLSPDEEVYDKSKKYDRDVRRVYRLDSDLNIIVSMDVSDSLVGTLALKTYYRSIDYDSLRKSGVSRAMDDYYNLQDQIKTIDKRAFITVGDDGTVYLRSRGADTASQVTFVHVFDAGFTYHDSYTIDGIISYMRCYDDTILVSIEKYPGADALDEASELRIINVYDRSFNPVASYKSIDIFETYRQLAEEVGGRPASSVVPLSGTRCMTVTSPWGYNVNEDGVMSSKILIIYDNEGTILGRYTLPGNIHLAVASSDTVYGFSTYFGPVVYEFSFTAFENE